MHACMYVTRKPSSDHHSQSARCPFVLAVPPLPRPPVVVQDRVQDRGRLLDDVLQRMPVRRRAGQRSPLVSKMRKGLCQSCWPLSVALPQQSFCCL